MDRTRNSISRRSSVQYPRALLFTMRSGHSLVANSGFSVRRLARGATSSGGLEEVCDMIVDAHCHAGRGDGLTGPWDTDAPIEPYLRRARAATIDRTIIVAPFHSDYAKANA